MSQLVIKSLAGLTSRQPGPGAPVFYKRHGRQLTMKPIRARVSLIHINKARAIRVPAGQGSAVPVAVVRSAHGIIQALGGMGPHTRPDSACLVV